MKSAKLAHVPADPTDLLELAYARGDHRLARTLARRAVSDSATGDRADRARFIIEATEPDLFLAWVGAAGLGLVAWLVYNYVL